MLVINNLSGALLWHEDDEAASS